MSHLIRTFARNLKRLRLAAGLSQEDLALRAGLHRTYVGSAERGERNVSLKAIERLAAALDVAPAELLSGAWEESAAGGPGLRPSRSASR
jgi:transcriptional regulator with XRE-family HTH domain